MTSRTPALPLPTLCALAALTLLACPSLLSAQGDDAKLPEEVFRNQTPISASDANVVIDMLNLTRTGNTNEAAVREIAQRHGYDDMRLTYVTTKFMAGMLLLSPMAPPSAEVARQLGTPLALPTPAELEAVRSVLPQLLTAAGMPQ
ncbi:MAG: hypothetical protein LBT40_08135 [Deltaproteobacteria bacterium]|jgi:hypothetical protein|nr:hypothetical protein [Deltaproteobacteria bacterium]